MTGEITFGGDVPSVFFKGLPYTKKRKRLPNYAASLRKLVLRPLGGYVTFRGFVLVGSMGGGKTEFARSMTQMIKDHYGAENVNAIVNKSGDLEALLQTMNSQPVQVLFCDDSMKELPKDLQHKFTLIRHTHEDILREEGLPEVGHIVCFWGTQDYFGLDNKVRRVSHGIILKTSTLDEYVRREIDTRFGELAVKELDRIDHQVLYEYNDKAMNKSIIRLRGKEDTGIVSFELVDQDPFIEIESLEEDAEAVKVPSFLQKHVESLDEEQVSWERVDVIKDPDFLKLIYDKIPEAVKSVKTHKYKPQHAEAWRAHFIEGIGWDHVAEALGYRSTAVFLNNYDAGGWMAILSAEVLGYALELALQERYYPECAVLGSNNPGDPDLFDEKTGLMVEVKMRKRVERASLKMLSSSELKNLREGKPTQVVIVTYSPKECSIHVWEPLFNPTPSPAQEGQEEAVEESEKTRETRPRHGIVARATKPETGPRTPGTGVEQLLELEEGLNPLFIPVARDILKKTMEAATAALVKEGGAPLEILEMSIDHTIGEVKEVEKKGIYDPETTQTIITYLKRYKERKTLDRGA